MDYVAKKPNVKPKEPIIPKQIKLALIGDSGVGKTTLATYSLDDERSISAEATNLVDITFKKVKLKETAIVNFGIWDFSGKQDSLRIRTELYQETHAVAYCFDLNNTTSFTNLDIWMKEVKKFGGERMIPICLGLKSDMNKSVDLNMIQSYTQKNKMNYFELSIKDPSSIKKFYKEFGAVLFEYFKKK